MDRVFEGKYKNIRAFVLENDSLKVTVIPESGSKIASIVYKPLDTELLWQNPAKKYKLTPYAASYGDGDFAGFDEMFPTISRCYYETPPWDGFEMPDHGEVWSLPWDVLVEGNTLFLAVNGIRFPYRLEKRLSLEGAVLRIEYRASNRSKYAFDYIWAAHPLFNTVPGMEFIVPEGMDSIVNAVPGPRLGGYGKVHKFPTATLDDGTVFDLSRMPNKNSSGYQKYYFCKKMTEGWCMLFDPGKRLTVGMAFPEREVPYLGMWLNEGGWADQYNIAPEPCTAAMDRVDFSKMWGMSSSLAAGSEKTWFLNIALSEGTRKKHIRNIM